METVQPIKNNLSTFRTLYLVYAILIGLGTLALVAYGLFFSYFLEGAVEAEIQQEMMHNDMPFNPLNVLSIILGVAFLFSLIVCIMNFLASKYIKEQTHYNLIFATAILNFFSGILGILLGVFTIVELNKPDVKHLFGKK
ncbi:hypothetical protein [Neptunitalea lumnitzerae]|uniref:DUF4064 domain-containing protein n=1 Tax=Neptunitalea lumnitzerae TaxID=2965509 RepID=A0ABQ5MFP7_9FLAO|nr:hypothetical protein [Neptunitalea sp. Y10]GLB47855.1 hypothetical protein Y10_02230 [Neptunitalea sp. Y10]